MANIQGKDLVLQVSVNLYAKTWLTVVCLEDITVAITSTVNTRNTRCGPQTGLADPIMKITGTAVVNDAPAANEVSLSGMNGYKVNNTLLAVKVISISDPTKVYYESNCYLSSITVTGKEGDSVDLAFQFDASAAILTSQPTLYP